MIAVLSHSLQALAETTSIYSPQRPEHLREDFCGTALICAVWCRGDCRRTATGLDIDQDALAWGCRENASGLLGECAGDRPRLCLLRCDVLDPVAAAECVSVLPGAREARELPSTGRAVEEDVKEPSGVTEVLRQPSSSGADMGRMSGQPGTKEAGEQARRGSGGTERVSGLPRMPESCELAAQSSDAAKCVSQLAGSSEAHGQANGSIAEAERMSMPGVLSGAGNAHEPGGEGCAASSAARPPCESPGSGSDDRMSWTGNPASMTSSASAAAGAALQRGAAHVDSSGPGPGPGSGPGADPDPAGQGAGDLRCKPADIVCAMNFSVCLLHQRTEVQVRPQRRHPRSDATQLHCLSVHLHYKCTLTLACRKLQQLPIC